MNDQIAFINNLHAKNAQLEAQVSNQTTRIEGLNDTNTTQLQNTRDLEDQLPEAQDQHKRRSDTISESSNRLSQTPRNFGLFWVNWRLTKRI